MPAAMDSPSVFGACSTAARAASGSDRPTLRAGRPPLPAGDDVLETSWGTPTSGWVIVRDVLVIGPWHHEDDLSHTHRRAPTDYDADHVLLRTVRA